MVGYEANKANAQKRVRRIEGQVRVCSAWLKADAY